MACRALSAVLVALVLAGTALADESRPASSVLSVGNRVRLRSTAVGGEVRGVVAAIDDQTLTLAPENRPPVKLPVASLVAVEMSVGHKRHPLMGLGAGLLGGLLLGLGAQVDPTNCGVFSSSFCSREEAIRGGALGGGLLGAAIGAFIKTDRWAPVQIGGRAVSGDQKALGIRVALRF
jgi:hypothetical protein